MQTRLKIGAITRRDYKAFPTITHECESYDFSSHVVPCIGFTVVLNIVEPTEPSSFNHVVAISEQRDDVTEEFLALQK